MNALMLNAGVFIVALFLGFTTGVKVEANRNDAAILRSQKDFKVKLDAKEADIYAISEQYETLKRERQAAAAGVDRAVGRVADRLDYAAACLDADGVRAANAAILGFVDDPGQLDPTVPAARTARQRK